MHNLHQKASPISPPRFSDQENVENFRRFTDRMREIGGGIPIGFKISSN
ncbi:MAG: hypothetical protein ACSHX7_02825 [Luteolibacter sp.]